MDYTGLSLGLKLSEYHRIGDLTRNIDMVEIQRRKAAQKQAESFEEETAILQDYEKLFNAEMQKIKKNRERIIAARIEQQTRLVKENQKAEAEKLQKGIENLKILNELMAKNYQDTLALFVTSSKYRQFAIICEERVHINMIRSLKNTMMKEFYEAVNDQEYLQKLIKHYRQQGKERLQQETSPQVAKRKWQERIVGRDSNKSSYGGNDAVVFSCMNGYAVGAAIGLCAGEPFDVALFGGGVGFFAGLVIPFLNKSCGRKDAVVQSCTMSGFAVGFALGIVNGKVLEVAAGALFGGGVGFLAGQVIYTFHLNNFFKYLCHIKTIHD